MYDIRPYEVKDRKQVEAICLSPETDARKNEKALLSKAILTVFCQYYIEQEPQNCFVATNNEDVVIGYVLCSTDFQFWEDNFKSLYLKKTLNLISKMIGKATIDGLRPYSAQYPAHLHINLSQNCQRQGLGTRLMTTLIEHLKAQGIPGVMLSVASDNKKAQNFYKKCGFLELVRTKREITMGMKLQ